MESLLGILFPLLLLLGVIAAYLYMKNNEEAWHNLKEFAEKNRLVKRLRERASNEGEEVENLIISTKDNKIVIKSKN